MSALNGFRVAADLVHLYGAIFLITGMVTSSSCISFSLRSIELYCLVFVSRYLDLDVTLGQWGKTVLGTYNILGKACFLVLSVIAICLVRFKFVKNYNVRADSAKFALSLLGCVSVVTMLFLMMERFDIAHPFLSLPEHHRGPHSHHHIHNSITFFTTGYAFSRVLESVAILPQVMLLSRVGGASPVVVSYVLSLGVYRLLYVFNWIYRYHYAGHYERLVVWCGCVQLLLLLCGLGIAMYWHRRRGSRWLADTDRMEVALENDEEDPLIRRL